VKQREQGSNHDCCCDDNNVADERSELEAAISRMVAASVCGKNSDKKGLMSLTDDPASLRMMLRGLIRSNVQKDATEPEPKPLSDKAIAVSATTPSSRCGPPARTLSSSLSSSFCSSISSLCEGEDSTIFTELFTRTGEPRWLAKPDEDEDWSADPSGEGDKSRSSSDVEAERVSGRNRRRGKRTAGRSPSRKTAYDDRWAGENESTANFSINEISTSSSSGRNADASFGGSACGNDDDDDDNSVLSAISGLTGAFDGSPPRLERKTANSPAQRGTFWTASDDSLPRMARRRSSKSIDEENQRKLLMQLGSDSSIRSEHSSYSLPKIARRRSSEKIDTTANKQPLLNAGDIVGGGKSVNTFARPKGSYKERKTVTFDKVQVRQYERILCENPSCSSGPSVGIGWRYVEKTTVTIGEWEMTRGGTGRPPREPLQLVLSRRKREKMVRYLGYSDADIASTIRKLNKSKFHRRQTTNNLKAQNFEETAESVRRKIKNLLFLQRKKEGVAAQVHQPERIEV